MCCVLVKVVKSCIQFIEVILWEASIYCCIGLFVRLASIHVYANYWIKYQTRVGILKK